VKHRVRALGTTPKTFETAEDILGPRKNSSKYYVLKGCTGKVLVTGGAVFIGSHLVDALMSSGNEVVVLDDLSSGRLENIAKWLMGVSVEIFRNASKCGLKIMEVFASCNYDGDVGGSRRNPLRHGVEVVMSIVRLVVEERPLLCLGLPGTILLLVGAFFGAWMLHIYVVTHTIETNVALASISFILIGLFILFAAVALYVISRLAQKINSMK